MGFALPWALAGLLAAAIPVVVHLIRRRDLQRSPLPTLALLERARVSSRRRMRLVDMLLLACRVMALALLAFGVAGPFVRSQLPWGDGQRTSVAIVLDDSMSMTRRADGPSPFAQARKRAEDIVRSLPTESQVAVILAGAPPRVLVPLTEERALARKRLSEAAGTARGTALQGAVDRAVRELDGARHDRRHLVVLSDFARHATGEELHWPDHLAVDVERMGEDRSAPNRAVASALAVPDPTQPGQSSVRVTVRAFGGDDGPVTVVLRHGDSEVARQRVDLVQGVGRAILHAPMPEGGDPTAHVELLEEDALAADDLRGVLLRSPNAIRVLVVNGDPHPNRLEDEVAFLVKALDVVPQDAGAVTYRITDADTLDARALVHADVLVLANVPAPSPALSRAVTEFVHEGGGLLIAPGHRTEARSYAARLASILPARPSATAGEVEAPGLTADERATTFPEGIPGLAGVTTQRRWLLEPTDATHEVPLRFADNAPALVVGRSGEGRTAVLATTVDDDWTDLPYRPGFVPLVAQLIHKLTPSARLPDRPFAPGAEVPVPVGPGVVHLRVVAPDGTEHDHRGPELGEHVRFAATERLGAYRVQVRTRESRLRDDARAAFTVAPPLAESDLTPGEAPEGASPRGEAAQRAEPGTVRHPIGPWFFLLAGLLLIAEGVLRRSRPLARGG
jgi:hypothetical protein